MNFEWDDQKDAENVRKHGVYFAEAQRAFLDSSRVIARDRKHSTTKEQRYFCFGLVDERVADRPSYSAVESDQDFRRRLLARRKEKV